MLAQSSTGKATGIKLEDGITGVYASNLRIIVSSTSVAPVGVFLGTGAGLMLRDSSIDSQSGTGIFAGASGSANVYGTSFNGTASAVSTGALLMFASSALR